MLKLSEFCPPGTQLNSSGLCEACPRGTYRVGDKQDQCTSCPGNVTTIETGHDQQSDCIIRKFSIKLELLMLIQH